MTGEFETILAIDQGTSSTKTLVLNSSGRVVASAAASVGEQCPQPGWVEQDPEEIWESVLQAVSNVLEKAPAVRVAALGLSTQRESLLVWDRRTGAAISPLLSWQDQRTADEARNFSSALERIRDISGLPLDPMFSALKAKWLLDRYDPDRSRAKAGELALGTVDSWLMSKFGGDHVIEIGNASRTQLLDIETKRWSEELCDLFEVPVTALPEVVASTGPFPTLKAMPRLANGTPISAVLGDSHAALYGHGIRAPGSVKATYGTGSSVMGLIGQGMGSRDAGSCLTIAWQIAGNAPAYAVEGNIRSSGSTLKWLAEIFDRPIEDLIGEAFEASPSGVQLVPAFNGLGAPYWDDEAMALLSGFKLGTKRAALVRAGLESIPHQVADVVESVERATGTPVRRLHADGGPSGNHILMQLQADLAGLKVVRPEISSLSAYGAARLAGHSIGLWTDAQDNLAIAAIHEPTMAHSERRLQRERWADAVRRSRGQNANADQRMKNTGANPSQSSASETAA